MIEYTLEEDLPEEFRGGKLSLNSNENKLTDNAASKAEAATDNKDSNAKANSNNDCYWGSTFISPFTSIPNKITETLWSKKTENPKITPTANEDTTKNTIQPAIHIVEDPYNFFTFRDSVIENAVKECCEQFLDVEADGPLISFFLLTQINHWDTDKERLVLLTPKSLVTAKYDFIALKRLSYKKLPLEMIDQMIIGNLVYPQGSLIPDRNMKGLRLIWNKGKPLRFSGKWNPFNEDVPFCTFTFHPLFFHKDWTDEKQKNIYSVEILAEMLCEAVSNLPRNRQGPDICSVVEQNIILYNYIGVGSLIHNRNSLGFFKVRGKFSF